MEILRAEYFGRNNEKTERPCIRHDWRPWSQEITGLSTEHTALRTSLKYNLEATGGRAKEIVF